MLLLTTHFRKPTPAEAVLLGAVAIAATVDGTQAVKAGGVSGLGMATMALCGLGGWAWTRRPFLPTALAGVLLPLLAFELYAATSMLWTPATGKGLQLLAVGVAFVAVTLLAARETAADPAFGPRLHRGLLAAGGVAVALYAVSAALVARRGGQSLIEPRSFALTGMVIAAVALSRWLAGDRRAGLVALALVAALAHSLSRTALVTTLLLVPAAFALRGTARGMATAVLLLAAGGAAFGAALVAYPPLYERFFGHDASLAVGGVSINAEGRTRVWALLLDDLGDDWLTGKGVAASEKLVEDQFSQFGLAQPHNDYIRFYYDGGAISLALWAAFALAVTARAAADLRRATRAGSPDAPLHAAALLALLAVSGSMFTDNPFSYAFVMLPLALILGASLGAGTAAAATDVVPAPV